MKSISQYIRGPVVSCGILILSLGTSFPGYGAQDYEGYQAVFDAGYYYEQNPDLQESLGEDPERLFQHFITAGAREGRSGREDFNLKSYVFYNPDLLGSYRTDLAGYCMHYMTIGMTEGRICTPQDNENGMIGTYTTHYDVTLPRATNVELAAQRINGCILQPGEAFSFGNAVQSRIPQNGYVMAPAIGGNEYGGGICQVSSTLYAAMCHALLPATERHPHSSGVSYLPAGLDATISEGYKDLKFVNIYEKPLRIQTDYQDGALTVFLWLGEAAEGSQEENSSQQPESEEKAKGPGEPGQSGKAETSDTVSQGEKAETSDAASQGGEAEISDAVSQGGEAEISDAASQDEEAKESDVSDQNQEAEGQEAQDSQL